ncbi:unnamed protein product [Urochloa humidicola]
MASPSSSDEEPPTPPAVDNSKLMDPRLLMAARTGNFEELENLLENQHEHITIQIPGEASNLPGDSADQEGADQSEAIVPTPLPELSVMQASTDIVQDDPDHQPDNDTGAILPILADQQEQATADAVEESTRHPDPAVLLLNGVTFDSEEDSALHVVAAAGDSEEYLKCARMIYNKAKHLLDAANKKEETPLHRAASAGNLDMVSCLIEMARENNHGDTWVKELLRKKNNSGETVLHGAIRSDNFNLMKMLISEDSELACLPNDDTSPLYLAISLRQCWDCVKELFNNSTRISTSGPDGQNVLHIAVFRGQGMYTTPV